jgi:hydroxymethylbilane synthase
VKLRLATRGSPLALWQAQASAKALAAAYSGLEVEIVAISSRGDQDQTSALQRFGRIGIFTVEVDAAVLDGRADASVHSLKDMTTSLQAGMALSAVLGRGPVEDVLVAKTGQRLMDLPAGARVATGSLRRRAMLLALRPDLQPIEIRGNVHTRLEKLRSGQCEALLMARAGLERLGLKQAISEVLDTERFLPAVGQGLVGLCSRSGDWEVSARLATVRDMEGWHEALAERALLRALRGGCNVPAGALARVVENRLLLRARVLSLDGREVIDGQIVGPRDEAEGLGMALAQDLLGRGAERLIQSARSQQVPESP